MKGLKAFLNQFFQNHGFMVFLSIFVGKLTLFINMVVVVKMVSEVEFGKITLIASVMGFFTPMNGLGAIQSLFKFTSLEKEEKEKQEMARYFFWQGFYKQIIITILFFGFCLLYSLNFSDILWIICCFSVRLIGMFFLTHIQVYLRVFGNNFGFASMNIWINILGLIFNFVFTFYFGAYGYVIALMLTPWLFLLYFKSHHWKGLQALPTKSERKKIWNYGFWEAFAYLSSELLFALDIMMIGFFGSETDVATYKVAIMIPMNLLFLPTIFIQTDYPRILAHHKDKNYLKFYLFNYWKVFVPVVFLMLTIGYFTASLQLKYIFKPAYESSNWIYFIALCGVSMAILVRVIFINFLSAFGKGIWNTYVSLVALTVLIGSGVVLIPKYGNYGACLSMAAALLLSGLAAMLFFIKYYNALDKPQTN